MKLKIIISLFLIILLFASYFTGAWFGLYGEKQDLRYVVEIENPEQKLNVDKRQVLTENNAYSKQILFGDFHVHTTFSMDAFENNLPIMQGEGAHPPTDACNFARFCSALDFYSINDHAESLTPERWLQTKQSIQQCNAISGDESNPDMVAFLGWEWTQNSKSPASHYGHKNIVLKDFEESNVPTRPIAVDGIAFNAMRKADLGGLRILGPMLDFKNRQEIYNMDKFVRDTKIPPVCPKDVHVKELPTDCMELAETPAILFEKLNQWNYPLIVIPHGTAWGNTTPAGVDWNEQLTKGNHDPNLQTMIEVYSGHGNSEEYRPWRATLTNKDGDDVCPEPSNNYTPPCWQAGKIINDRCLADGETSDECQRRSEEAKKIYLVSGKSGFRTIGGSTADDWLNAGQCDDCFLPSYNYRPGLSAQGALAIRNFKQGDGESERFKFGFIGSSDNHSAKAGTGYKEINRLVYTDTHGIKSTWLKNKMGGNKPALSKSVPNNPKKYIRGSNKERSNSFMFTGGLVAAHSEGRSRQEIWQAVQRNEVYATSGPRIMLWFDLINGPENDNKGIYPMGQSLEMNSSPKFKIHAKGALKQKPGCPEFTVDSLGQNELDRLCKGECYNPSDERHPIVRLEVIKITPQIAKDEPLDGIIHDVWKSFDCPADGTGCSAEFIDDNFVTEQRDSVFYVRAIQKVTPTINGGTLNCEYDENGNCIKVNSCYSDERTATSDDCLGDSEHRAWSSPIYIDYPISK